MSDICPVPAQRSEAMPDDGYGALLRDCYEAGPRRGTHLQVIERDDGCAAGRHMLALVGDHEVIGIDPSPGAVAVAVDQGLDARVGSVLEPGDIGTFDTIMLLGGNLGLFGSADQTPRRAGQPRRTG